MGEHPGVGMSAVAVAGVAAAALLAYALFLWFSGNRRGSVYYLAGMLAIMAFLYVSYLVESGAVYAYIGYRPANETVVKRFEQLEAGVHSEFMATIYTASFFASIESAAALAAIFGAGSSSQAAQAVQAAQLLAPSLVAAASAVAGLWGTVYCFTLFLRLLIEYAVPLGAAAAALGAALLPAPRVKRVAATLLVWGLFLSAVLPGIAAEGALEAGPARAPRLGMGYVDIYVYNGGGRSPLLLVYNYTGTVELVEVAYCPCGSVVNKTVSRVSFNDTLSVYVYGHKRLWLPWGRYRLVAAYAAWAPVAVQGPREFTVGPVPVTLVYRIKYDASVANYTVVAAWRPPLVNKTFTARLEELAPSALAVAYVNGTRLKPLRTAGELVYRTVLANATLVLEAYCESLEVETNGTVVEYRVENATPSPVLARLAEAYAGWYARNLNYSALLQAGNYTVLSAYGECAEGATCKCVCIHRAEVAAEEWWARNGQLAALLKLLEPRKPQAALRHYLVKVRANGTAWVEVRCWGRPMPAWLFTAVPGWSLAEAAVHSRSAGQPAIPLVGGLSAAKALAAAYNVAFKAVFAAFAADGVCGLLGGVSALGFAQRLLGRWYSYIIKPRRGLRLRLFSRLEEIRRRNTAHARLEKRVEKKLEVLPLIDRVRMYSRILGKGFVARKAVRYALKMYYPGAGARLLRDLVREVYRYRGLPPPDRAMKLLDIYSTLTTRYLLERGLERLFEKVSAMGGGPGTSVLSLRRGVCRVPRSLEVIAARIAAKDIVRELARLRPVGEFREHYSLVLQSIRGSRSFAELRSALDKLGVDMFENREEAFSVLLRVRGFSEEAYALEAALRVVKAAEGSERLSYPLARAYLAALSFLGHGVLGRWLDRVNLELLDRAGVGREAERLVVKVAEVCLGRACIDDVVEASKAIRHKLEKRLETAHIGRLAELARDTSRDDLVAKLENLMMASVEKRLENAAKALAELGVSVKVPTGSSLKALEEAYSALAGEAERLGDDAPAPVLRILERAESELREARGMLEQYRRAVYEVVEAVLAETGLCLDAVCGYLRQRGVEDVMELESLRPLAAGDRTLEVLAKNYGYMLGWIEKQEQLASELLNRAATAESREEKLYYISESRRVLENVEGLYRSIITTLERERCRSEWFRTRLAEISLILSFLKNVEDEFYGGGG